MKLTYSEREAADIIGCYVSTLKGYRRTRQIGCIKVGKEPRYTMQHITDFIKFKERPCAASPNSLSTRTRLETSNPTAGISNTMTESEAAASVLGAKLAAKTKKPAYASHRLS